MRFLTTQLKTALSTKACHNVLRWSRTPPSRLKVRHFHSSTASRNVAMESVPSLDTYDCSPCAFSQDEQLKYQLIDGSEPLSGYGRGGYHPVMINDIMHDRYTIVDKLDYSTDSTTWLAADSLTEELVALKVGIAEHSTHREARILQALSSAPKSMSGAIDVIPDAREMLPQVLDEFEVQGPNGVHHCYSMPLMLGDLEAANFHCVFPLRVSRALAARLAVSVALVHSQGFVHGDIHLRNVLVRAPSDITTLTVAQFAERYGSPEKEAVLRIDGKPLGRHIPPEVVYALGLIKSAQDFDLTDTKRLVLGNFEETFAPATETRVGRECDVPTYQRAPEAMIEPDAPLSYPSDVWSLATAIWDIIGMKFLFGEWESVSGVVAQQIDVLGIETVPGKWRKSWEQPHAIDGDGSHDTTPCQPIEKRDVWPPLEDAFEEFVQRYRREDNAGLFDDEETHAILALLRGMLMFQPEERLTMEEVLRSDWMVKWALPELK